MRRDMILEQIPQDKLNLPSSAQNPPYPHTDNQNFLAISQNQNTIWKAADAIFEKAPLQMIIDYFLLIISNILSNHQLSLINNQLRTNLLCYKQLGHLSIKIPTIR